MYGSPHTLILMLFDIQPSDTRPIYLQIMDEVRRGLVLGLLEPDDALPSVRQLASDLRVNPNTVQQAYRELEREGFVYVRRGRGTFVADSSTDELGRQDLIEAVAERAMKEAYRNGVSLAELVKALEGLQRQTASSPEEDLP